MTIPLDIQPDIERGLQAQVQAKGVSLAAYAGGPGTGGQGRRAAPAPLGSGIDRCLRQVRGLLTDAEFRAIVSAICAH